MKCLILLSFLMAFCGNAWSLSPEEIQELWQSASDAYTRQQYEDAVDAYERIAQSTEPTATLYYNLGNCYYRLGQTAAAVLSYERALKLRPLNKQTRENLDLARRSIEEAVIPLPGFFLVRWVRQASWLSSPVGWGVMSLLFLWCSIGLLSFMLLRQSGKRYQALLWLSGICFAFTTLLGAVRYSDIRSDDHGIVMNSEQSLYVAPDAESAVVREISGGERVMVLDSLESFFKVRLMNYEEGWLPVSSIERI